jgi:hypothetical protein
MLSQLELMSLKIETLQDKTSYVFTAIRLCGGTALLVVAYRFALTSGLEL